MHTKSRRGDALLIYLCLSGERVHTRESLACLLWEDASPKNSMGSLRQIIRKLRQVVPEISEVIDFGRSHVTVKKAAITSELDDLVDGLAVGDLDGLRPRYDQQIDEFLADFVGLSAYLDSWIAVMHNQIDFTLRDTLARVLADGKTTEEARDYAARTLIYFDPTNEPACCHLMQRHWAQGDSATALAQYRKLYDALDEAHDSEPSEETQALVVRIQMGEAPQTAPRVQMRADLPSIHVAELKTTDLDPASANLGQLLRYELFASLSTFREWRLFDAEPSVPDYYRLELLATYVGAHTYLVATLKILPDQRIVWSERFDIRFDNWTPVQQLIAKRLSLAVNQSINLDRLRQRRGADLQSQSLFDDWIQAHTLLGGWNPAQRQEAVALLDGLMSSAPDFAPARSSRANAETTQHLSLPGLYRSREATALALEHARHALRVDPLDTRAHLSMGWALAMDGQREASLLHLETCRELNPCSTLGSLACALGFAFAGEADRATEFADETLSMVGSIPPFLWGYVQNIRYLNNDLGAAIDAGQKAGASIANLPGWHAAALWEAGRREEARDVADKFYCAAQETWASPKPFNAEELTKWHVSCFPLNPPEQSDRLAHSLSAALASR